MLKKKLLQRGFSFIETMVAMSLLMVSIAVVVTILRADIAVSSVSENAVTSRFLAQEGIEYSRHVRDSHLIDFHKTKDPSILWLGTLEACFDNSCVIDTADPSSVIVTSCSAEGCPSLKYNKIKNRYGYGSGTEWEETSFVREIEITNPNGGVMDSEASEAIVTVRVVWKERNNFEKKILYQQSLFNWIK